MAMYNLSQLMKLWAQDKVTQEQAIGQILLHLNDLAERLSKLEQKGQASVSRPRPEG